jgi:hypothetical protein
MFSGYNLNLTLKPTPFANLTEKLKRIDFRGSVNPGIIDLSI